MGMLRNVSQKLIQKFIGKTPVVVYENPLEEIHEAATKGKNIRLWFAQAFGAQRGVAALSEMKAEKGGIRGEESYLFATRRYPTAINNVLPIGNHIPPTQYPFFNTKIDGQGDGAGFPAGFKISSNETNLVVENQVPSGQGFRIFQEGIAFNAEAFSGDIEQILDSGDLQFQADSTQYNFKKGPLTGFPGGWGVSGFTAVQGAQAASNGVADIRAVRKLAFPRRLKPLKTFGYLHNVGVNGRATDGTPWQLTKFTLVRLVLWGDMMTKMTG